MKSILLLLMLSFTLRAEIINPLPTGDKVATAVSFFQRFIIRMEIDTEPGKAYIVRTKKSTDENWFAMATIIARSHKTTIYLPYEGVTRFYAVYKAPTYAVGTETFLWLDFEPYPGQLFYENTEVTWEWSDGYIATAPAILPWKGIYLTPGPRLVKVTAGNLVAHYALNIE